MQMQTVAAARKERRRQERIEKKAQEAAERAARCLRRILGLHRTVQVWKEDEPVRWVPFFKFKWGLWTFVVSKARYGPDLLGFHPRYGWFGFGVSWRELEHRGFVLEEAGTNV